jgi:4-carboxymuconolactone decarboxylase
MTNNPAPRKSPFWDIAPALSDFTDNVLFGDVWKRPQLSQRDRSLVTVSSLVAQYRMNELPFHLKFALENGVTHEELIEAITHLAFYAGWPTASTAIGIARRVFAEQEMVKP